MKPKTIVKEEPYHHNPNYKIKFPGKEGYHFPIGEGCYSPCMEPTKKKGDV